MQDSSATMATTSSKTEASPRDPDIRTTRQVLWGPDGHKHVCIICSLSCLASEALRDGWEPCPLCRVVWCCSPTCQAKHREQEKYECFNIGMHWVELEKLKKRKKLCERERLHQSVVQLYSIAGAGMQRNRALEWSFHDSPRLPPRNIVALEYSIEHTRLFLSPDNDYPPEIRWCISQLHAAEDMPSLLAMNKLDEAMEMFSFLFCSILASSRSVSDYRPGDWIFGPRRSYYDPLGEIGGIEIEAEDGVLLPFLVMLFIKVHILASCRQDKECANLAFQHPETSRLNVLPADMHFVVRSFLEPEPVFEARQGEDISLLVHQIHVWDRTVLSLLLKHANDDAMEADILDWMSPQNWKVVVNNFARTPGATAFLEELVDQFE